MSNYKRPDVPTLVIVRGIPGSGKSHLAIALGDSLGMDSVVILDPDATDYSSKNYTDLSHALTTEGVDAKFHPYRFLRMNAYEAIAAHKIVIWNQGFIDLDGFSKTVNNLQAYAADHSTTLPTLVVEVEIDADTARARIAERVAQGKHDVPDEAFRRFVDNYASFSDKGYTTVRVSGEGDTTTAVSSIVDALSKLWNNEKN
jgi:thymidylate kinase